MPGLSLVSKIQSAKLQHLICTQISSSKAINYRSNQVPHITNGEGEMPPEEYHVRLTNTQIQAEWLSLNTSKLSNSLRLYFYQNILGD